MGYVAPHPLPSQARRLPGGSACVPPTRRAAEGETALPDECPRTVGRSLGGVQGQVVWAPVYQGLESLPPTSRPLAGFEFPSGGLPALSPWPRHPSPLPTQASKHGGRGVRFCCLASGGT